MIENVTQPQTGISHKVQRIFGLDLMRACSILMVFLAHSIPINPFANLFPFDYLFIGVEAFFVLSGLLIGRIILNTIFRPRISWRSIRSFWVNRWLRTFPAYLLTFAIHYYIYSPSPNRLFYLIFVQNIVTPPPGFFPHSWSLAVEEWFYLLFPCLLLAAAYMLGNYQNRHRIYLTGIVFVILLGLLAKLGYHLLYSQHFIPYLLENKMLFPGWKVFDSPAGNWDNMRKMVPFRIDSIAYGCLIAYILEKYSLSQKTRVWLLVAGIIGIVCCFPIIKHTIAQGKANFFTDVFLLPFCCCSFALMLPYAVSCPRPGKWAVKLVTTISLTSYSFYLIHVLILERAINLYQNNSTEAFAPKWAVFAGAYGIIYLVSLLMYNLVELPFMNYRKKLSPN
ncbi:acyltransferase [Dyadobacter flavalbus]|uniref:Acyltransferase n=1 Tax=Dyadobacter flavalbus TaxID=2579942 RepID=A0A5M8QY72_9BACT|nr:acyltransferase [Dyadobacter flavalbus]KAA6440351.1 acyltransferase [Dyadobacter flavalbus]